MSSRNSGQSFQSMIKRAANSTVGHRVVQLLELFPVGNSDFLPGAIRCCLPIHTCSLASSTNQEVASIIHVW